VAIKPVKDKPSLVGYQAVVIGSAIRMGSWLPEAMAFARDNQARLSQLPTSIFTVHLLNTGDDAASQAARQAYTAPVRQFLTRAPRPFSPASWTLPGWGSSIECWPRRPTPAKATSAIGA
jgi:menaquinone-dependent protoporphyrinogen oxidase